MTSRGVTLPLTEVITVILNTKEVSRLGLRPRADKITSTCTGYHVNKTTQG